MSIYTWCTKRAPGLSLVALAVLCYLALIDAYATKSTLSIQLDGLHTQQTAGARSIIWLKLFVYYSLFIHICVFAFPVRSCWAVFDLTESLREDREKQTLKRVRFDLPRRTSIDSVASELALSPALLTPISSDEDTDISVYSDEEEAEPIIHAVLIPNYKEDMECLRETLDVLASHPQAIHQYDIYLAMESREEGAETKALTLISEFVKKFRFIDFTLHPGNIVGEAAGKGSNAAWAAREASKRYSMNQRRDVIFTGIDADSHLPSRYFSHITSMHVAHPETQSTTMYCPPIIFDRNAHLVPIIVRVADILWCAGGLSGLHRGSSISPPTSVYSMPLELVDRVAGWDTGPEDIGEDLHMYLKAFFALNGNLTTRTIFAPVSQTNVTGTGSAWRGQVSGCQARYKQGLRHMWGALDSGFAIRQAVEMIRGRKSLGRSFGPLHLTNSANGEVYVPDTNNTSSHFSTMTKTEIAPPDYLRLVCLFHRLLEAHFLPTHMLFLVLSSALISHWLAGQPPNYLTHILRITNYLRIGGAVLVAVYLYLYEAYHAICVETREEEMKVAGLWMQEGVSKRSLRENWCDYLVVPVVATLFGSAPALQAQFSHFWTLELGYVVSGKFVRGGGAVMAESGRGKEDV